MLSARAAAFGVVAVLGEKGEAKAEETAKANVVEYECNQGDHSFMGWPHETAYRPYQPYNVLNRR